MTTFAVFYLWHSLPSHNVFLSTWRLHFADLSSSQHLQKLKRKEGTGAGSGAAKKTPASQGKKRTKTVATGDDDDDDDDDAEPTPSKKPARGKKGAATATVNEDEVTLKPIKNEQYAFVYPAVPTLQRNADCFSFSLLSSEDSDKDAV